MSDPMALELAQALLANLSAVGVEPQALAQVIASGTPRSLADDQLLYQQGAPSTGMAFLVAGTLRVERPDAQGRPRRLASIQAPALVGHMGVVDRERRSASVTTEGPVTVIELESRVFDHLVQDDSDRGFALRQVILVSLARRLTLANARLRELTEPPLPPADPSSPRVGRAGGARIVDEVGDILSGGGGAAEREACSGAAPLRLVPVRGQVSGVRRLRWRETLRQCGAACCAVLGLACRQPGFPRWRPTQRLPARRLERL